MAHPQLTATYVSPSDKHTISSELPPVPQGGDIKAKTAYLSALRSNITQVQGDVNILLTRKMEVEKATDVGNKKDERDAKAEEMYGEEADEEG